MSHIVTIKTEVRDPVAVRAACDRLYLPESVFGESRLFSGSKTGWDVQLPDWRYPFHVAIRIWCLSIQLFSQQLNFQFLYKMEDTK